MTALHKDLYLDQGADWPGEAFAIVDADGNPKILGPSMIATGFIADRDGATLFTWSNNPTAGQGLVQFQGQFFIPTVTAAQTLLWRFANAPYQLYLEDPAAPLADRKIRVGDGTLYLSRAIQ